MVACLDIVEEERESFKRCNFDIEIKIQTSGRNA